MDGAYKGKWTDPGGFVQRNRTFTYVWECREGTEGTWLYHDHGPMDPLPVFRGLFGPLLIRKQGEVRANRDFFLAFHTWDPSITGPQEHLLLRQRQGLRRKHSHPGSARRRASRISRIWSRQLLPHLPPAWAPLERTGWLDRRQQELRPGGLVPLRNSRGQPRALVLSLPCLPASAPGDERLVRRHLGRPARWGAALVLTAIVLLASASSATALNTRVSISNFAWSSGRVDIDLGEKVTWDWIGPDLAHSVTGVSSNALQWDSDPQTDAPSHRPGDSFTLQFEAPGTYVFQCKLHSVVRGEVVVSDTPGDPNSDPGPQAPLKLDVSKPTLGGVALRRSRTRGTKGIGATARISERGTLDAEYYRLRPGGQAQSTAATPIWKTFIGINHFNIGARWQALQGTAGPLRGGAARDRPRGQHVEAAEEAIHHSGQAAEGLGSKDERGERRRRRQGDLDRPGRRPHGGPPRPPHAAGRGARLRGRRRGRRCRLRRPLRARPQAHRPDPRPQYAGEAESRGHTLRLRRLAGDEDRRADHAEGTRLRAPGPAARGARIRAQGGGRRRAGRGGAPSRRG